MLWPVVWCSGQWSGALASGLVLWPVVATPRRQRCERDERVLCLGVRGVGGVYNVQGLRGGRGVRVSVPCVCTWWPEMALAYALTMSSAMADTVRSRGEQGEAGGLTVGVEGERIAVQ